MCPRLAIPNCQIPRLVSGVNLLTTERHVAHAVEERLVRVHRRLPVSARKVGTRRSVFTQPGPSFSVTMAWTFCSNTDLVVRPCPAPTLARAAALPSSAASRSSPRPPPTSTCPTGTGPTAALRARTRKTDSSRGPAWHWGFGDVSS